MPNSHGGNKEPGGPDQSTPQGVLTRVAIVVVAFSMLLAEVFDRWHEPKILRTAVNIVGETWRRVLAAVGLRSR